MGGQLIKGYSIQGESQGVVGLTKSWKLYRAKKGGSHVHASIFLIEKRQLKKSDRQQTIKVAKKQASNLVRVRHPGVLAIVQPLTEDDNILAFVAERVQGTISQLIKQGKLNEFMASELQLKLSLYQFLQAVSFIHDTLKQAHLALSLDNIYITTDGKWKLAGFGSNQLLTSEDIHITEEKIYDYSFTAPELALSKNYNRKTDNFSIGVIILRLLQFIHKQYKPLPLVDKADYQKHITDMKKMINSKVFSKSSNSYDLQEFLRGLLQWQNSNRFTLSDALASRWMNDSTLTTVKYLDKISNYENKQQLQFLKGLAGVLDDFDNRVVTRIILPKLLDMLKFSHLIASIIFITIDLLKKNKLTPELFREQIWPAIKGITQGKEMNAQSIFILVFNMQILQKVVGQAQSTTYLLPLYIKCFDCPPKLKHLALINLQRLSKKIEYQIFKTRIIPKLLHILKDPVIETRKDALRGLYAIIKAIDAQTMSLSVLPALQGARKAGCDPFINSIINTIYIILTNSLPTDVISTKILPVLIPYLSDPSINRNQFYQFKTTIINMINRIQKEREKHFDNSAVGKDEQTFTEADFKFSEQQNKPKSETKGNYNFLNNYIQVKKQKEIIPQQISNPPLSQNNHVNSINPPQQNNTNYGINPSVRQKQPPKEDTLNYNAPMQFIPMQINPTIVKDFSLSEVKPQVSTVPSRFDTTSQKDQDFHFANTSAYQPMTFNFPEDTNNKQATTTTPELNFPPVPQPTFAKQSQKYQPIQIKRIQKKSPKKLQKPKVIENFSDQMQIKKTVNPSFYSKPNQSEFPKVEFAPSTNSFNFGYTPSGIPPSAKQDSIFNMDFDNLGGLGMNNYSSPSPSPQINFGSISNPTMPNNNSINTSNLNHIRNDIDRNNINKIDSFSNPVNIHTNTSNIPSNSKGKAIKPITKPISKPLNQKPISKPEEQRSAFRPEEHKQMSQPQNEKAMSQLSYNYGSPPASNFEGLDGFNLSPPFSTNIPLSRLSASPGFTLNAPKIETKQGNIMNDLYSVFQEEQKKGTFKDDAFNLI